MAERVSTGGTITFEYQKGHTPKINTEQKKEIRGAYEKYYKRKAKEKKRRNILIALAVIILLIIFLAVIFIKSS